jgi:hypothetical protein
MTAEGKVAVEDAVEVENPGKTRAIRRAIDLLRITHPPTSGELLTKTKSWPADKRRRSRSVLTSRPQGGVLKC